MSFIAAPQRKPVFDQPTHVQSWPASTSTGTMNGTMNCTRINIISRNRPYIGGHLAFFFKLNSKQVCNFR